jgi:hypothetical protein
VSRERYAVPREKIEDKIARWSGMVVMSGDEAADMTVPDEEEMFAETINLSTQPSLISDSLSSRAQSQTESTDSSIPKSKPLPTPGGLNKSINYVSSLPSNKQSINGDSRKNKKKKKKHRDFQSGEPVMVGNPNEKGISLSSLPPRESVSTFKQLSPAPNPSTHTGPKVAVPGAVVHSGQRGE